MKELAPIPTAFTSVVATREFVVERGGASIAMLVEFGLPAQDVETVSGFDWRCPVRITEGLEVRERQACGVDSVQALQLAFVMVEAEVDALSRAEGTAVRLFDAPYDGFP